MKWQLHPVLMLHQLPYTGTRFRHSLTELDQLRGTSQLLTRHPPSLDWTGHVVRCVTCNPVHRWPRKDEFELFDSYAWALGVCLIFQLFAERRSEGRVNFLTLFLCELMEEAWLSDTHITNDDVLENVWIIVWPSCHLGPVLPPVPESKTHFPYFCSFCVCACVCEPQDAGCKTSTFFGYNGKAGCSVNKPGNECTVRIYRGWIHQEKNRILWNMNQTKPQKRRVTGVTWNWSISVFRAKRFVSEIWSTIVWFVVSLWIGMWNLHDRL